MLGSIWRCVVVGVLATVLLAAAPAVADRGADQRPEPPPMVQRNGCVTWAEFNLIPMEEGSRIWTRAEIEAAWQARGVLDRELTDDDLTYYDYRRCDRLGYGVLVIYLKRPGRGWIWVAKTFPCPCPGARDAAVGHRSG